MPSKMINSTGLPEVSKVWELSRFQEKDCLVRLPDHDVQSETYHEMYLRPNRTNRLNLKVSCEIGRNTKKKCILMMLHQ